MTGATYVVRVIDTGLWVMGCCDDLHGAAYDLPYEEYPTRLAAEAAATRHRAEDKREQEIVNRRISHCCRTCGQPVPA